MFSGIVEEIGTIKNIIVTPNWTEFCINANLTLNETKIGDSIAVNGTCLTVTKQDDTSYTFQAVPETLSKTNLKDLTLGNKVNLERAITGHSRIGGHMVQGHVDRVCNFIEFQTQENGMYGKFSLPSSLQNLIVNKGFITLDGMSLTVVECYQDYFTIAFIPHTITATIVQFYQPQQSINLEVDIIGKYVQQYFTNMSMHHVN